MSLLDSFFRFIKGAVGNNMDNDQEDVITVKRNLNKIGYFDNLDQDPEPHGFITKEMDTGIRSFQKDNGLKIDGILLPQGETEQSLRSLIGSNIEKEELPPMPTAKKFIEGTNIEDKGIWEGETPYKSRFEFKPEDKSYTLHEIKPSVIDRSMHIPYDESGKIFKRKYWDT